MFTNLAIANGGPIVILCLSGRFPTDSGTSAQWQLDPCLWAAHPEMKLQHDCRICSVAQIQTVNFNMMNT